MAQFKMGTIDKELLILIPCPGALFKMYARKLAVIYRAGFENLFRKSCFKIVATSPIKPSKMSKIAIKEEGTKR